MIRLTVADDVALLPPIERSAGLAFKSVHQLEWLADDTVMDEAEHQRLLELGASWVIEQGRALRGFLCAEAFADELHIWELAVELEFQGRGLGRRLLDTAEHHARSTGLEAMTLTTFVDVAFNAPFYVRLGYERLVESALTPRLVSLLAAEADHGLPRERRCAMRKPL